MCGITGLIQYKSPINKENFELFTNQLAHRGPDGLGTFYTNNIALGHRRLSILDLSEAANCPLLYEHNTRKIILTFNGEIFNFIELRKELEAKGYRFKTSSDTEIIPAAYIEWGTDCFLRFNGMWALALYDFQTENLFLCRDRFSEKPLYYISNEKFFAFSSEIKAFLSLEGFKSALEMSILTNNYKDCNSLEGAIETTLLKGVLRLPGGCFLCHKPYQSNKLTQWWNTSDHIPTIPTKDSIMISEFRDRLYKAVKIRMRSDVPISTCLSGGLDSSSVVAVMQDLKKKGHVDRCPENWQHAFIATFKDTENDEREYADIMTSKFEIDAHYLEFNQDICSKDIVDSIWANEYIYHGIITPPMKLYSSLKKAGIRVSIDGHGGDELLGGYSRYLNETYENLNARLYQDFHYDVLPSILRNFDRVSSFNGVEIRSPFLDWELVTYSFGLKAELKIGNGFSKYILREALKEILPMEIYERRAKKGFSTPLVYWFNNFLEPLIIKCLNHPLWSEDPLNLWRLKTPIILKKTKEKKWQQADFRELVSIWSYLNTIIFYILFIDINPNYLSGE